MAARNSESESTGGQNFYFDYHLWRQKKFPSAASKATASSSTTDPLEDAPPGYEEIDLALSTENSYSTLQELRESLNRVRSALTRLGAAEKWESTDIPGKRGLCELICGETRLSFAGMANHKDCARKVECQWLEEDFLKVFVALFSQLRQTETETPLDVLLLLARTVVVICPLAEGTTRDIASQALDELSKLLSSLSFEKEMLVYDALLSNHQSPRSARYVLYRHLYKRLLEEYRICQSCENADARKAALMREVIRTYVARGGEFLALAKEFASGSSNRKQKGETALAEGLATQLTAALESMNGHR